jgi:hypothetical protein
MIINAKTKMSKMSKVSFLLKYSDIKFIDEIKKFKVVDKFKFLKVANQYTISIGDMFQIWDVKDNNQLMSLTIKCFLKDTRIKKFLFWLLYIEEKNLPLIDFTRLIIHTQETGELAAKYFQSLKVLSTDERIDEILNKYKGDPMDMISRFCKMFPAYTIKEALKMSWYDVYLAFKTSTKDNNIQIEISKLKPL